MEGATSGGHAAAAVAPVQMITVSWHYFGGGASEHHHDLRVDIIEDIKEDYGMFVWPCSVILAEYVGAADEQRSRFSASRVVEVQKQSMHYKLLKARGQPADMRAAFVWQNSAPPRVQMFMWLLNQRKIQCRTVLQRKHVLQNANCEVCHLGDETPEHIISGCALGSQFWEKLNMNDMIGQDAASLHSITPQGGVPREEFSAFVALSCWQLWKARNAKVFRNETVSVQQVFRACKETAERWKFRFKKKKKEVVDVWCQLFEMAAQS